MVIGAEAWVLRGCQLCTSDYEVLELGKSIEKLVQSQDNVRAIAQIEDKNA